MEQEEAKRAIRLSSSVSKKSCHGLELQETGIVTTLIARTENQKSRISSTGETLPSYGRP